MSPIRNLLLVAALALSPARAAADRTYVLDLGASGGRAETGLGRPSRLFSDLRPALTLQLSSPRWVIRAGYVLDAMLEQAETRSLAYSNQATLGVAAELSARTSLFLGGSATQGATAFRLTRGGGSSTDAFARDTNRISASVNQAFAHQASPAVSLGQSFTVSADAPMNARERANTSATLGLGLGRSTPGARNAFGLEFTLGTAQFKAAEVPYWSHRSALAASWARDLSPAFTARATAGVEQVLTLTGSFPLSIVPRGSLAVSWAGRNTSANLNAGYGVNTDVVTGTLSKSRTASLGAAYSPVTGKPRTFHAAVGVVQAEPFPGFPAAARLQGRALQAEVGVAWGLTENLLATGSYGAIRQWGRPDQRNETLQVFLVGLTARLANGRLGAVPTPGSRVDGSDAVPVHTAPSPAR